MAPKAILFIITALGFQTSFSQDDGRALKVELEVDDSISICHVLTAFAQSVRDKGSDFNKKLREVKPKISKDSVLQSINYPAFQLSVRSIRFKTKDTAEVSCGLSDYEALQMTDVPIMVLKRGNQWTLGENSSLRDLIDIPDRIIRDVPNNSPTSPIVGQILIPEKHPGTRESQNVYVINQTLSSNHLGRFLFSPMATPEMDVVTTDLSGWEVGFNLDCTWERIVYGWLRPDNSWLKSYGDHPGDFDFDTPISLAIDPFDTVFVADKGLQRIVKLYYNRSANVLTHISEIFLPAFAIEDCSYDQGINVCSPNDDGIWVADYLHGQLVMINRAGSVVKRITHYTYNGTTYPLRPAKVAASRFRPLGVTPSGPYIGVINRQRTYWPYQDFFVTLDAGSMSGTTATALRSTEYPTGVQPPHYLVSLGIDIFGQFWVGDDGAKQYHTCSQTGDYLASYASNPSGSPVSISRTREHFGPGCSSTYSIISIHTADPWGPSTGLNYFLPGADVVNLAAGRWTTSTGNDFNVFGWTATNKCYLTIKVRDPSTGTYVKTIYGDTLLAGHYSASVPHYELPYGNLELRAWVRPYYDYLYPHPRGDILRETTFYNRRPISNVFVMRTAGTPPTYVATVTGGEPPFIYGWTMRLKCCSGASPNGGDEPDPTCNWQAAQYANGNTLSMDDPNYSFWVRVNVYDSQGSTKERIGYVERGACIPIPGGGCPFVFAWDGRHFVEDNNILPQSETPENRGRDVVDRYRLMQPPVPRDNQYVLQIREFENERSYLDQIKLIAVDHNSNREVAMNAVGDVVSYEKKFKLKHARLRTRDVLQRVKDFDSLVVSAGAGAILDFGFTPNNGGGANSADEGPPRFGADDADFVLDGGGYEEYVQEKSRPLMLVSTNAAGMTSVVENLIFRRNSSIVSVPITLSDSSNMQLVWSDSVQFDYVNLGRVKSGNVSVHDLPLQHALYDGYLSVREQLICSDSVYAELSPVHFIELRYGLPPRLPNGRKRTFFLVSKGRYEPLPDSSAALLTKAGAVKPEIPKVIALRQNYPNPFNPTTTIRIDLPQPENVKVSVYDVLGREVIILAEGTMPAGYHSLPWSGTNSQGNSVSSGVYFVILRVDDGKGGSKFLSTRKLLLTK